MKDIRKVKAFGNDNKKWNFYHNNKLNKEVCILVEWHDLPKEIDNQEVEVIKKAENNSPIEIIFNNKIYTKVNMKSTKGNKNTKSEYEDSKVNNAQVQTPYNFVPLNNKVIATKSRHDDFSNFEGNSGYIDINIKNLTPLYIKGKDQDHFKIGSHYAIPGSSLRGMLRTLVEMVTWSKFQFFNDKFISYRLPAQEYCDRAINNRYLGFLTESNKEYFIEPFDGKVGTFKNIHEKYKYTFDPTTKKLKIYTKAVGGKKSKTLFFELTYKGKGKDKKIKLTTQAIKNYIDDIKRGSEEEMADVLKLCKKSSLKETCIEKGIDFIGIPIWYEPSKNLDGEDVAISFGHCKNYRVPHKNSIKNGVENGQPNYNNKELIDFAESIFGIIASGDNKIERAGKVYIEDAISKDATTHQAILQILSSPYPKNEKIYLVKGTEWNKSPKIRGNKLYWHRDTSGYTDKPNLNAKHTPDIEQVNYNKTRFRKKDYDKFNLYNTNFFVENIQDINVFSKKICDIIDETHNISKIKNRIASDEKSQFKFVHAINKEATFSGRIRFDNLTNEELGALLFVLNLPEGCKHKIGTGKPIGMGSIEILTSLHLIDRSRRYHTLFENNIEEKNSVEWNEGVSSGVINTYIAHFTQFMKGEDLKEDLWDEERMQALKVMLTYSDSSKDQWLEDTNYMSLKGFGQSEKSWLKSAIEIHDTKSHIQ